MNNAKRAFTLIELLVVIAIIGILAAILIPVIGSVRQGTNATKAVSNIRQIGQANLLFAMEHNNQINGQGNTALPGQPERGNTWRLAPYINSSLKYGTLTWREVWTTLRDIHDPNIPEEITWGPKTYRWGWAFNDTFSMWKNNGNFVNMLSIDNPAKTLYATSGIFTIKPEMATDETLLSLPEGAARNGIYYTHKNQTPAVYLDGHAELLEFPFSPQSIDPDWSE